MKFVHLTSKEFEIMKTHCEHGYEILQGYLDEEILDMMEQIF